MADINVGSLLDENVSTTYRRASQSKANRPKILPVHELLKSRNKEWSIYSATQNLPSVLNDPNNRELDLFTRSWGEGFIPHAPLPPTSLPNIELGDFLCYLKETSSGRKSHRAIVRDDQKNNSNPSTPVSPSPNRQLQLDGKTYDLNSIPKIFLQKDFSLVDPRTFLQVIPLLHLLPHSLTQQQQETQRVMLPDDGHNMAAIQSTKLLHEKLTHHVDSIEVHLAHQISLRSDLFFSTLASQRELESLVVLIKQDVLELRHRIRLLDRAMTHPSLKMYYLRRQKIRLNQVCSQLEQIANVHQTQHTIQLLLGTSDFVGALELITRTQSVLSTELQGVTCLRHLSSQLDELEKAIEAMMENDLVHVAMTDVSARLECTVDGERIGSPESAETEIQLESVVKGLLRRRKRHFMSPLKDHILKESRKLVKQNVEEYLKLSHETHEEEVVGGEEEELTLAKQLRSIDFNNWYNLLEQLFSFLLRYMRCIQKTMSIISTVCQEEAGVLTPTPTATPTKPLFTDNIIIYKPLIIEEDDGGKREGSSDDNLVEEIIDMEQFANQEADDRLDQLLMENEMTHITESLITTTIANNDQSSIVINELTNSTIEHTGTTSTGPISTTSTEPINATTTASNDDKKIVDRTRLKSDGGISEFTFHECHSLVTECHEITCSLCDLLHSRCTKLMNIRAKAGLLDNLHPSDFVRLVRLIGRFINSSSGITSRSCTHLRLVILSQAKKFLDVFHENKKDKLKRLLDGERWRQADVPNEVQRQTKSLEEGLTFSDETNNDRTATLTKQSSQHAEQMLSVHGQKFAVVGVLCILITMITDYCQTADDLPMLVTDTLSKLVELLKYFNSRTCQLVLGAGAVEVVGLKTITTRHLAIVLRCLQAIMLLIQDIKTFFRKRLTPKKCVLLLQFDQVNEDIGSHCREINHKIVTILDELIGKLIGKWEIKSPVPSQSFKTITKQLLKLHEALDDLLPTNHLQALFQSIENNFKIHLKTHLAKQSVTNNGSTEHGIVNSELTHMKSVLQPLEHINVFGSNLFDIWTIDNR